MCVCVCVCVCVREREREREREFVRKLLNAAFTMFYGYQLLTAGGFY